jgi:hypothetical protein
VVRPDGSLAVEKNDRHTYAIPLADGTIMSTPGYDGFTDGIKDCRVLENAEKYPDQNLQAYLQQVRATIPCAMLRPGKVLPQLQGEEVVKRVHELMAA